MFTAGRFATLVLAVTMGIAAVMAAPRASAEEMGSTCSDCAQYRAKYSVDNMAMFTIEYQFKWGKHQEWRTIVLERGARHTHTYRLGTDPDRAVPIPYVRFRKTNGDWSKVFEMEFYAVMVEAGYGGKLSGTQPKRYQLIYTGDFQKIELTEK